MKSRVTIVSRIPGALAGSIAAITAGHAAAQEEDIRGPKAPVEIPVPTEFSLTPWLIAAAIAAAAALAIWWWMRRRARRVQSGPEERALGALEELDRMRNSVDAAPLADRAADIVRRFIAEKFGIAAPQRTTEEFLRAISQDATSPLSEHSALLRGFLRTCDAAKFAGADFDAAERLELLAGAFRFIRAAASPAAAPTTPALPQSA